MILMFMAIIAAVITTVSVYGEEDKWGDEDKDFFED